ncbi:MAG: hypothetical protein OER85_18955, partial [Gammaproteobacteria bacterium]|nr:hypothetical protein [Gammaproteobacteria bacterium]
MNENGNQLGNGNSLSDLRRYCFFLIEFISSLATDPHLYFQHKLIADISRAENWSGLMAILDYLIEWIDSADLPHMQMIRLDEKLVAQELPSYGLMSNPANRELGRILLTGQVATEMEYALI